ncbi:MAG TPA: DUF3131 domain-containing protein [Bryobacteraceae bacterium]
MTLGLSSRILAAAATGLLLLTASGDFGSAADTSPKNAGRNRPRRGGLTESETAMAKVAWKYFENNTNAKTGLANAVDAYPSTTMWDTASYLAGLLSAHELGIVSKNDFDRRMAAILKTLNEISFFHDELPNKAYSTDNAQKVDYANKPGEIGYSAIDLGRLLIWLKIIKERYPEHGNGIDGFVARWHFCSVVDTCGTMYGAVLDAKKNAISVQEGRLGYEEYAAKGFQLWGFNTERASKPEPYDIAEIFGIQIPYDRRDPRLLKAHNYVVCESYILDGLELDWDEPSDQKSDDQTHTNPWMADFAQRVYQVQENRYKATGILTARTEHQLDGPPYFVYDTIYSDGYPWNTITDEGLFVPEKSAVSLKAALGLWSLWNTEYTDLLFDATGSLFDPAKGFYEGRYEKSGAVINTFTANNNGIILEALLHKVQGKLLKFGGKETMWDRLITDEFEDKNKCLPQHRLQCSRSATR